jgi:hypothetical protein
MQKVLIGAFYTLQGLGSLALGLFIGGVPGGGGFAMEILIKAFLVFASCLSLFTALTLFLRRTNWARLLGDASSILLGVFYAWTAFGIAEAIALGSLRMTEQYLIGIVWILASTIIAVLNLIIMFSLRRAK